MNAIEMTKEEEDEKIKKKQDNEKEFQELLKMENFQLTS